MVTSEGGRGAGTPSTVLDRPAMSKNALTGHQTPERIGEQSEEQRENQPHERPSNTQLPPQADCGDYSIPDVEAPRSGLSRPSGPVMALPGGSQ